MALLNVSCTNDWLHDLPRNCLMRHFELTFGVFNSCTSMITCFVYDVYQHYIHYNRPDIFYIKRATFDLYGKGAKHSKIITLLQTVFPFLLSNFSLFLFCFLCPFFLVRKNRRNSRCFNSEKYKLTFTNNGEESY